MSFRKFKPDYLFDGFQMREMNSVLVCHEDGSIEAIIPSETAGDDIEKTTGLISPGLINCHCHLELSFLRGKIPEKTGLTDFVFAVMNLRNVDATIRKEAITLAEAEMIDHGIVAVGDICNTADTIPCKSMKRMNYYNFIESAGWIPKSAVDRFNLGKGLYENFNSILQDEKHLSINPHAPYSVSELLWELLIPGFTTKTITIHNQETSAEDEFFKTGLGKFNEMYFKMNMETAHFKKPGISSLQYSLPKMNTAQNIILVHNTYTTDSDIDFAVKNHHQLFFCLCPNANLYIEDRLPDIPKIMHSSNNLVLGTDSLASNSTLSILEEMKTIRRKYPEISTATLLTWATSNGAKALQMDGEMGDFVQAERPGVVLIDNLQNGEINNHSVCQRLL